MPRAPKTQSAAPTGPRLVAKSATTKPIDSPAPQHEDITRRAYELFLEDGAVHGRDMDHWLRAEQELSAAARLAKKTAAPRAARSAS
jgi:Protein of unknown function (DUF2934)